MAVAFSTTLRLAGTLVKPYQPIGGKTLTICDLVPHVFPLLAPVTNTHFGLPLAPFEIFFFTDWPQ